MKSTADVVIIGGGIMGASTAYHLAKRGADVVLLETAEMFGLGSTGLNAGGIRYQFATPVNIELSKLSIGTLRRGDGSRSRPPPMRLPVHARRSR
jgi:sarcosine oxidase subunit beta